MIQDLHSHTYYSFCGKDSPEAIVEAAIAGGIELFGISDHNSGVGLGCELAFRQNTETVPAYYGRFPLRRYFDHLSLIQEKYKDRIRILRGIEITGNLDAPQYVLPDGEDVSFFDYCLVENPNLEHSIVGRDLFSFAERCGTPTVGVAHTDMFAFIASLGEKPYDYFRRMADQNIFWEMNVSYDSIHGYREHAYMLRFLEDTEQQAVVRESGVRLSVGFDGHRVEDYLPERIADVCRRISAMGIRLAFERE